MPELIADKDYYADADGKLVDADDSSAVSVVAHKGTAVEPETATRYGITGDTVDGYDAVADHERLHGGETEAEAKAKRKAMFNKAKPAPENKAATPDETTTE